MNIIKKIKVIDEVYDIAPANGTVTEDSLSEELKELLLNALGVSVDEEDITINDEDKLQFKDRQSDTTQLGYVILRKDKSFLELVIKTDTIYEIRYTFSVSGYIMPANCTLKFNGGKLTGSLTCKDTTIDGLTNIFDSSFVLSGSVCTPIRFEWFGAVPNNKTVDNSSIIAAVLRNAPNNSTIDLGGNTFYIYVEYTGTTSKLSSEQKPLTEIPIINGKSNIVILNGCIDVPDHTYGSNVKYYPISLGIMNSNNIVINNLTIRSKGEKYGNADGYSGDNNSTRINGCLQGGGNPIFIGQSKQITINNCLFEYCGSCATVYVSSSQEVIINNSIANPYSLGYAAFAIDDFIGQSGTHSMILNNVSTYKGNATYGCKAAVTTEGSNNHTDVTAIVNGGYFEGGFWEPNRLDLGTAFMAENFSTIIANNSHVKVFDHIGATGNRSVLKASNITGSVGKGIHRNTNTTRSTSTEPIYDHTYIEYTNCNVSCDGRSRTYDRDAVKYTHVLTNTGMYDFNHYTFTNCKFTGFSTFALSQYVCYGYLKIKGGEFSLLDRILDVRHWGGGGPSDDDSGIFITDGAKFTITSSSPKRSLYFGNDSNPIYSALCIHCKDLSANSGYFNTYIDKSVEITLPSVASGAVLPRLDTVVCDEALRTNYIIEPKLKNCCCYTFKHTSGYIKPVTIKMIASYDSYLDVLRMSPDDHIFISHDLMSAGNSTITVWPLNRNGSDSTKNGSYIGCITGRWTDRNVIDTTEYSLGIQLPLVPKINNASTSDRGSYINFKGLVTFY